jgi:hypothetical protein
MTTTDRHVINALELMTHEQVAAWRQRCHALGQQRLDLVAPLTALASTGYDNALTAVSIAFSRCERDSLRDLAILLEQTWRAEIDAGTRNAWRAAKNLAWSAEMSQDPLAAEFLNPTTGDLGVSW